MDEYLYNALNAIKATCYHYTYEKSSCKDCPMCDNPDNKDYYRCKLQKADPHEWQFEVTKIYRIV